MSKQDQQNHKEVVEYEKKVPCDGKQHLIESLREKCFRIKVSTPVNITNEYCYPSKTYGIKGNSGMDR